MSALYRFELDATSHHEWQERTREGYGRPYGTTRQQDGQPRRLAIEAATWGEAQAKACEMLGDPPRIRPESGRFGWDEKEAAEWRFTLASAAEIPESPSLPPAHRPRILGSRPTTRGTR